MRSRAASRAGAAGVVFRVVLLAAAAIATAVGTRTLDGRVLTVWFVLLPLVAVQSLADLGTTSRMTTAVAELPDPLGADRDRTASLYRSTVRLTTRIGATIAFAAAVIALIWRGQGDATVAGATAFWSWRWPSPPTTAAAARRAQRARRLSS